MMYSTNHTGAPPSYNNTPGSSPQHILSAQPVSPTPMSDLSSYPSPLPRQNETGSSKSARAKSSLVSRNVTVTGHRTSVRLEPEMWNGLSEICRRECASTHEVCTVISTHKPIGTSLTAAIRVFIMAYFRAAATEDGHNRAGHGPGGHMMMSMSLKPNGIKR